MSSVNSLGPVRTQVLVVGAGPVGLLAALRLRQLGIEVRLIDQQPELRAHTFPVVLHAQSLRLLQQLGVSAALFWRGRQVRRLAVYTEYERRAVLDLHVPAGLTAGALTLPQDILRRALTNELARRGVSVEWDTRLALLQQDARTVWGRLTRETPASLLLPASRSEVAAFEADFVIGADGYESTVRDALGVRLVEHGPLQTFAFFDATTHRAGHEAQLAFSEEYVNSAYPLQGGQARFSFQLGGALHKPLDGSTLRDLVLARMPWHGDQTLSCDWSGIAEFRHALVESFGVGRVWLAGEAAHLTGPLGVQSLNVGLDEANELALRMTEALRAPYAAGFGEGYSARRVRQWRELLGLEAPATVTRRSPLWARRHVNRLLGSLPASGSDLDELLAQLRLTSVNAPPDDAERGR